jgi:hypothetical protein
MINHLAPSPALARGRRPDRPNDHGEAGDVQRRDHHAQVRTRRTVPMTSALYEALKRMDVIHEGFVVRNLDGRWRSKLVARAHLSEGWPADPLLTHPTALVRDPRRPTRREPLAAADLDGPQADRRDHALRPHGRTSPPRHPGGHLDRRPRRDRSGHPDHQDARCAWQPRGSENRSRRRFLIYFS